MQNDTVYDVATIAALRKCTDLSRIQKLAQKWKIEVMGHHSATNTMVPRNEQKLLRDLAALRWAHNQPEEGEKDIAQRSVHDCDRVGDQPVAGPSRQTAPRAGTAEGNEPMRSRASVLPQTASSSRPASAPSPEPSSSRPAQSSPQGSPAPHNACIQRDVAPQAVRHGRNEELQSAPREVEHAPQRRPGPSNERPPSPPAQRPTASRQTETPIRSRPPQPSGFRTPQNAPSKSTAMPRAGPSTVPQRRPGYPGRSRPSPMRTPMPACRPVALPPRSAARQSPLNARSHVGPIAGPSTLPQRHNIPSSALRDDAIRSSSSQNRVSEREPPRTGSSGSASAAQYTALTSTPNAEPSAARPGSLRRPLASGKGDREAGPSTANDPSESRPAGTSTPRSSGSESSTRKRPRGSPDSEDSDEDAGSSGSEGKRMRLAEPAAARRVDKGKGRARDDAEEPSPRSLGELLPREAPSTRAEGLGGDMGRAVTSDRPLTATQQRQALPCPDPPSTSREVQLDGAGGIASTTPRQAEPPMDPEGSRAKHARSSSKSPPANTSASRGTRPAPAALSPRKPWWQDVRLSSQPLDMGPILGSRLSDAELGMGFPGFIEEPDIPQYRTSSQWKQYRRLLAIVTGREPEASPPAETVESAPGGEADAEEDEDEDGAQVQEDYKEVDEALLDYGPTPAQRQQPIPSPPTPLPIDPERQRRHDDAEAMLRSDAHGMVEALLPFFRNRGFVVHRTALMERMRAVWADLAPAQIQYDLRTPEPGEPPTPFPIDSETAGPTAEEILERARNDDEDVRTPHPTPPGGGFASGTVGVYLTPPLWTESTPNPLPDSPPLSTAAPAVTLEEAMQWSLFEPDAQPSGSGSRGDSSTSGSEQGSDGSARAKRQRGSDGEDDGDSSSSGSKRRKSDSPELPPRKIDKGKARAW